MYTSPTLYKTSSTGKELQWQIKTYPQSLMCSSSGVNWEVLTSHGQVDGKIQDTPFVVTSGKNIGKANETTIEEQADAEALSKFNKQIDKGYSEERGGSSKQYKPMLAHKYEDHKNKVTFPCYVQPKLDGMRCIAIRKDDEILLMSRGGKVIEGLNHIRTSLMIVMMNGEVFDGELYNHELTFQDLISLVKRGQERTNLVQYHVYDIINAGTFKERFIDELITVTNSILGPINFVSAVEVNSHEEIKTRHDELVREEYEGAIVRHGQCLYKEGGRSNQLLKVKDFLDQEFEIVDVIPSEKYPTHGIIVCRIDGTSGTEGVFSATPEGPFELKEQYLREKYSLIGKFGTVRFFEWTTSEIPVPRFPIFVQKREIGE